MAFYPRLIEEQVREAMAVAPVVCVVGARQTGKTTLVRKLQPTRRYINLDDATYLQAAKDDPVGFIEGLPNAVILDEIQRVPELLLAIKMAVDEDRFQQKKRPGRFLLTGSANLLLLPKVSDSLAGRMQIITLNPLTEWEKHAGLSQTKTAPFKKENLLAQLLSNSLKPQVTGGRVDQKKLANAICTGGYPEPNTLKGALAEQWYRQYLNAIVQKDIQDIASVRDGEELIRLIELLCLRTASLLNQSNLANELRMDRGTVEKYISVLEKLFLIRRLPAWHHNQAKRLIKTPKIHVIDSGLASVLSKLTAFDWDTQASEFGGLLESFAVQQLICQSTWNEDDCHFYHYRDKDQVEVDLVIEQGRKVWGVEIKRSGGVGASDSKGLARLADQAGKNFKGGMLLYAGNTLFKLENHNNCYAVPLNYLWE